MTRRGSSRGLVVLILVIVVLLLAEPPDPVRDLRPVAARAERLRVA